MIFRIFSKSLPIALAAFIVCSVASAQAAEHANPWRPVAQPQVQAQKPIVLAARKTTARSKKPAVSHETKLHNDLMAFMKKTIASMNKQRRPGLSSKEVKKAADGMYTARYIHVDLNSLEASYKPSTNKVVKYIGQVVYHEVEYVSRGTTERQALAGPFNEYNRVPVTELIKYMRGKWTY